MKNWVLGVVMAIVLIASAAFSGLLYLDLQGKLDVEQQKVAALNQDINSISTGLSGLQGSLDSLESSLGDLGDSLSELGDNVSSVNSGISALGGKVSSLEATAAGLSGDISSLQSSVSGLNNDITSINNSISGIQSDVSGLQGDVSDLQSSVTGLQASSQAMADVAAALEPSVVKVVCLVDGGYSGGTGGMVRQNGYVLTNYHVVDGALAITVTLSTGEIFSASIAASDAGRDLAVLKLNTTRLDFKAATLGSSAATEVGEQVIAMGYPLLFYPEMAGEATFTSGIISAKRTFDGYNWLQTDAAINRGNSGGPLVNLKGEVIGINTLRVFTDDDGYPIDNIGFAIPIDEAKALIASAAGS